ncbi:MAG: AsmA-like C-terminal region-containing protein, partial [Vicinamibacterales bacterium]
GPVGTLDVKAGALDLDQLVAFASDFVEGSAQPARADGAPGTGTTAGVQTSSTVAETDLTISIAADRATMSGVALERVSGKARLQGTRLTLDPMQFGLFGGTYEGALGAALTEPPSFSWKAALKNVDVAAVTAFAGNPGVVTGRLAATIDLVGTGIDAATALKTARGSALVSITNGVVQNLALVKSAVAATSLNPQAVIASSQGDRDEPFSEMGATLAIASGTASTQDLRFVSKDILLNAGGGLRLDGTAVTLQGALQMSEELSKQANGTVVRVTQQDGRITLPATVRGTAGKYSIEIDTAGMAKRALTNEAKAQSQQAITRGIGRLLGR